MVIKRIRQINSALVLAAKAFGGYKFQILILTILGLLSGLLGGIGINALIPLLSFLVGEETGVTDPVSRYIREFFLILGIPFSLKSIFVFIILLFFLKALVVIVFSYINAYIASSYEEQTRSRLFKKMTDANWKHLLGQKLGHLEKILMNNVEQSRNFLSLISVAIAVIANLIVYSFIAVSISFKVTFLTFILGGIFLLAMTPLLKIIKNISSSHEELNRKIAHHINENIMGMKIIKVFSAGGAISKAAEKYFRQIKGLKIKSEIFGTLATALVEPVIIIFIAVIFAVSYKSTGFHLASLLVLVYLIKQIFIFIRQIQDLALGATVYAPYLKTVLDYEKQVEDFYETDDGRAPFVFNDGLKFEEVSFYYQPESPVLKNLNLEVKKGEMVGLIGPSGAGKTTVVDLILRLFEPIEGKILLDGRNSKEISLREWRKNIGYVPQDIFLINDTIAENIRFHDEAITDEDLQNVGKTANLLDFVHNLPAGFNTLVGERGVALSGGQRQRIALARVLARKPQILVLDEATSALDGESEKRIQEFLETIKGRVTMFVIAHRLSTVMSSDRLLILENGEISEEGVPPELLKNKNSYFYKVSNITREVE